MFKRSITTGELVLASLTVLGAVLAFWINTNVRLSVLENERSTQAETRKEMKEAVQKISDKLDRLNDGQNEIKVSLQNKQDKK